MTISINVEKVFDKIQHPIRNIKKQKQKHPSKLGIEGNILNLM